MIVARTGVRPHQQVFQITQRLLKDGRIAGRQSGRQWEFWLARTEGSIESANDQPILVKDVKGQITSEFAKPKLTVERLITSGFALAAQWRIDELSGKITAHGVLPKEPGVYAFAISETAVYVGVAKMGLSKRLYFCGNPGSTQRTSRRLNRTIRDTLKETRQIEIYTAQPQDLEWRGLPVSGIAGLEVGLIQRFHLPWNIRAG